MKMKRIAAIFGVIISVIILTSCAGAHDDQATVNGHQLADLNYRPGSSAVVKINHDHSTLRPNSWHSDQVKYANLDHLNRASHGNTAYLYKSNVANDSLRHRQYVYPSGWHQGRVGNDPVINRGHLIAYSLSKGIAANGKYQPQDPSGDQNNPKNLFTQTAFSNQKLQTIYENKVRQAIRHGKKVIYQVKPIFKKNDLMARGVHIQAISTDRRLNFNVYIFNVQPDVQFNYETGRPHLDRAMKVPTPKNAPDFSKNHHLNRRTAAYRPVSRGHFKRYSNY